jgi:hypothetical protein
MQSFQADSEEEMTFTPVGIDIAKNIMQLHYIDEETGEIVNLRKLGSDPHASSNYRSRPGRLEPTYWALATDAASCPLFPLDALRQAIRLGNLPAAPAGAKAEISPNIPDLTHPSWA